MFELLKKPSAFLPILMSALVICMEIFVLSTGIGVDTSGDEGVAAHLFQILMGLQVPLIGYFVIRWIPAFPKQGVQILALQIMAGVLACAPVFFLHL